MGGWVGEGGVGGGKASAEGCPDAAYQIYAVRMEREYERERGRGERERERER